MNKIHKGDNFGITTSYKSGLSIYVILTGITLDHLRVFNLTILTTAEKRVKYKYMKLLIM